MDIKTKSRPPISDVEYIALAALLISLVAMSIDAMLPALKEIGRDLHVESENDTQLIVSALFLGLAIAQCFFGPFSDSYGRKNAIYLGLFIFLVGGSVALFSSDFEIMLVGRLLQGIGAAGPKVVTVAAIRDRFEGASMAKVMSSVMAVFILVPVFAPAVGQTILAFAHWRAIYLFLMIQGVIALIWFGLRQPETLLPPNRLPFSLARIFLAIAETIRNRVALGFTIVSGCIFGAFLGYLSSAQQVFQDVYGVGRLFPVYFGLLASAIGIASLTNARWVSRLGMFSLSFWAVLVLALVSLLSACVVTFWDARPPLWMFLCFMMVASGCSGILFGNLNSLAMKPLGHIAGTAAAVIASLSTFLSLGFGISIGRAFDGTVVPIVFGFMILAWASLPVMLWTQRDTGGSLQGRVHR